MNKSLYRLGSELALLETAVENPEEINQTELIETIKNKVDNCCDYSRFLDDRISAIDNRIKELKELKEREETKAENLLKYFKLCLDVLQVTELNGKDSSIKIRKLPPSLKVIDETLTPIEFIKTKCFTETFIDKRAILAKLKQGEIIEGFEISLETKAVVK